MPKKLQMIISLILLLGHDDEEIEFAALNCVDGILFNDGIIRI